MSVTDEQEYLLVLKRCRTDDLGHTFGLRSGDTLLGVDGAPWRGSPAELQKRLAQSKQPSALSFQRRDVAFTILTSRADLGQWQREPIRNGLAALPQNNTRLQNWEIVGDVRGNFDVFATAPALLALIVPPLWLAQVRLWAGLAVFIAVAALALPGGLPLMVCVWIAAGVHLWQAGTDHLRAALRIQGYFRAGIIAAQTEAAAMEVWCTLNPNARFRFSAPETARVPQSKLG